MNNPKRSAKKIVLTLAGIAIFIIGAVLGSFFIFGSSDKWSSFSVSQADEEGGQDEKIGLQEEQGPPLTPAFFNYILEQGAKMDASAETYASEEFFSSVALPYLEQQGQNVFPNSDLIVVQSNPNTRPKEYGEMMTNYYVLMAGSWQKVLRASSAQEDIDEKLFQDLQTLEELLDKTEQELLDMAVPPQYENFHKRSVALAGSIRVVIRDGFLRKDDPVKQVLIVSGMEDVAYEAIELSIQLADIKSETLSQ